MVSCFPPPFKLRTVSITRGHFGQGAVDVGPGRRRRWAVAGDVGLGGERVAGGADAEPEGPPLAK